MEIPVPRFVPPEDEVDSFVDPALIKEVAERHRIPKHKMTSFRRALAKARFVYLSNSNTPDYKLAPIADTRDLCIALKKVRKLVRAPGMCRRLEQALARENLSFRRSKKAKGPVRLSSLEESLTILERVARSGAAIDGRKTTDRTRSRARLHGAAYRLWLFWTEELGQSPSVQNWGSKGTPALEFLLDSLHCFNPKVKEASLRGFEEFRKAISIEFNYPA
jgi:hypothetical protein